MGVAADLTDASWPVFNRLLDEALELPAAERLSWLEALGPEHERLKPALRELLEKSAGTETRQWLATLPRSDAALPAVDESDLAAGAVVGPYRLLRELGLGGMGAVWLAERADGTLKRQVALKLPRATWTRGLAERMARERDILAALEHPNIARLYDAGTDAQGRPFLALEYVEGQPIDVYCRERSLAIKARLQLLLQVAQAVAFAHSRLVIHRDLKPSNILVTDDGSVRLLDFGIAKLMEGDRTQETQLTQVAGRALTLDYASPEQIRGEPIGTASDVYSLGVVAYELLAGAKPYKLKRGSAAELEETIATVDAPLASSAATEPAAKKALKGDLDAILNKALKKAMAERYPTVDALAQDLRRYLNGDRVLARPDTMTYRLYRALRRHRTALTAAAVVLVSFGLAIGFGATALVVAALLAGIGAAVWQARKAREEAQRARVEARKAEAVKNRVRQIAASCGIEAVNVFRLAGRAQVCRGRYDLAEEHYRRALTAVASLESGPSETFSVNGEAELAEALAKQGKIAEAIGRLRRAYETAHRVHGPHHRWTLVIQMRLANMLLAAGFSDEGVELRAEVERTLAKPRAEYDLPFRAEMAGYLASGPALRGRPDLALPFHEQDVDDLRRSFPGSQVLAESLSDLADALIAYGRYDEAEPLLDEALVTWRSYTGDKEVPARRALLTAVRVHLARARDRGAEAIAEAESVELPDRPELGRFHPATLRLVAERALAEAMVGRSESAQARLTKELAELSRQAANGRQPLAEARLLSARATVRERIGDVSGAATDYGQSIALREQHGDPDSLWLAVDLAHFAACLARLDRPRESATAEQRAAAILNVQPAPGSHLFAVGSAAPQAAAAPMNLQRVR